MQSRLLKICLILITLAVLVGVGTYVWSVVKNIELKEREIADEVMTPSAWRHRYKEFDLMDLRCRIK